MNQISRHIAYLLLTCRKINVPGLGTFSAAYEKASFDAEYGYFYPARIRINYDSQSSVNDFVLCDSLKRKLKIKEEEAQIMIKEFAARIILDLKKHHYCKLEGIGYLILNNGYITLKDTFWKRNKYAIMSSIAI